MNRNGFFPPSGEVDVYTGVGNKDITITGASTIVDVALGPNGMWSIIDQKRSKVFTYDANGVLLFAFGDMGDQVGNIQNLQAIAYQGSNILLLDSTNNTITVYKRTAYGDLIASALQNTEDQNYDAAVNYYTAILQRNNNYDSAYVGIGQSLYRDGEYLQAMQYFKYAYDTENYSEAYSAYRKEWVKICHPDSNHYRGCLCADQLVLPPREKGQQARTRIQGKALTGGRIVVCDSV